MALPNFKTEEEKKKYYNQKFLDRTKEAISEFYMNYNTFKNHMAGISNLAGFAPTWQPDVLFFCGKQIFDLDDGIKKILGKHNEHVNFYELSDSDPEE